MRMSTEESRDEELALETIATAAEAGITVFDTARAYGRDAAELGHNERLLARGLRRCGADASARIVTKGGMTRSGGRFAASLRAAVPVWASSNRPIRRSLAPVNEPFS